MRRESWIQALQIMLSMARHGALNPEREGELPPGPALERPAGDPAPASRITWVDQPARRPSRPGRAHRPRPAPPAPPPEPPPALPPKPAQDERIEWDGGPGSAQTNLARLVGVEDAFEHTPLEPGERVAYCQYEGVAYHLATWEFLRRENGGRCCSCGRPGTIVLVTLPGKREPEREPVLEPKPVPSWLEDGQEVICLEEVYNYIGQAVVVEAQVYEVYRTQSTGTHFVRFEERQPGDTPFSGFKVVIFPSYEGQWSKLGLSPRMYAGRRVRVRGLIQSHPTWGIEILVNSPRVIQILEAPAEKE